MTERPFGSVWVEEMGFVMALWRCAVGQNSERERERGRKNRDARANHQTNKNKEITQGNKPVTWLKLNANREIKPVLVLMGDAKELLHARDVPRWCKVFGG